MKWDYKNQYDHTRARRKRIGLYGVAAVCLALGGGVLGYSLIQGNSQPAQPQVVAVQPPPKKKAVLGQPIIWPAYGQSAYGVVGYGVVARSVEQQQLVPIASLAKTITALAVLQKKPLEPGQTGPVITITAADAALYNVYLNKGGAVAHVEVGQQLTQYDAIQIMLLHSANNVTQNLAVWAFGSEEAYTAYANTMVKKMGLKNTTVADATGFSPQTVSTAADMTQIAESFMNKPLLKQITLLPEAQVPISGTFKNHNAPQNTVDEIGIKTGNTEQAGRCFMAASFKNGEVFSLAVVLGAPNLPTAMTDSHSVLRSGNASLVIK